MKSTPDLAHRFQYHPPRTEGAVQSHELVRAVHRRLAEEMDELLPNGREKALAITKIEESMFWANASIARYAKSPEEDDR